MIKLCRVLACDSPECGNVSIDVLRTIDPEKGEPDWQGWVAAGQQHFCPECAKQAARMGREYIQPWAPAIAP